LAEAARVPVGAVMVVGGGIAGLQAALDLAESGFYVYLVERSPSIGGMMARLDKTFPTNDCAMCILSPKLVECGRHLNIEVLTHSELVDLRGQPGDFTAVVRTAPRYVDPEKCTGCGDCEKECPVRVPNEYEGYLSQRRAIYRPFPQAFPNAYSIEKSSVPLCQAACPSGVHAQGYVALLAAGKYREAVALIKRDTPFPAICGRVCNHPCEANCKRGLVDEPVAIAALKRFLGDWEAATGEPIVPDPAPPNGKKVAVVGGGPAGLSCAFYLALRGYGVTVYEAAERPGGMMVLGIPAYRLPREVLDTEIEALRRLGVEIRCGVRVGEDITVEDLRRAGYDAYYLAVGAHGAARLGIPGEHLEGVISGVEFLRRVNLGQPVAVGERVAVIGGGNVAMDAARSALRLGAREVWVLYRRSRNEMPAAPWEREAAEAEGVRFEYLIAPLEVLGGDRVVGLRCQRMRLGAPDASGRRRPEPIPGQQLEMPFDTVIQAVGQAPHFAQLASSFGVPVDSRGWMKADVLTGATEVPGVFAGGDAVTGPRTLIEAIAAGKRAAESIHRYLEGRDLHEGRQLDPVPLVVGEVPRGIPRAPRARMPELPVAERVRSFAEVDRGLDEEAARAEAARCLACGVCASCYECERVCRAEAVRHQDRERVREIRVGAVVLCPGFDVLDARGLEEYGLGKYPDVVTSVQFERILSASGPYEGHVRRPSDGRVPRRIAFVQCVGSRDVRRGRTYCSAVCCMYAIKEAVIAKEHVGDLETTIFYMDMRAYGKDFEQYYRRAREEYGVRFVPAKVQRVTQGADGSLKVRFAPEEGEVTEEEFDLVVLSVGMAPEEGARRLAERLGIQLDEDGFPVSPGRDPVATSRPGVFVCGPFAGPKDIPETVVEASAAAAAAGAILAPARGQLVREKEYPPERPVEHDPPRIGVFVCHCGINIGGVVDVPQVAEYARSLPGVVYAEHNLYTCSQDTQQRIKELIAEYALNRVVVASCSPRTHEALFQETIREAGLNPHLFQMANIRDQCSWVHMAQPEQATAKAKDLVRMAVARAALLRPLREVSVPVTPSVLVIGGGPAGMTAALEVARQGFEVHLVEQRAELGGHLRQLGWTADGSDAEELCRHLVREVESNARIRVYLNSQVGRVEGFVGNFRSLIRDHRGHTREVEHGAIIVATGAVPASTDEYLCGSHPRVITQLELERRLRAGELDARRVVFIGCVGSREEGRPYCSRVCCIQTVKCALKLLEGDGRREVYLLYRDVRTYGLHEEAYRRARERGMVCIRYQEGSKPEVRAEEDALLVRCYDPILGHSIELEADLVVLGTGLDPAPGNRQLAQLLKVPLNQDGFFLEAHVKLRPVDFATDGVFVAGTAHAPKLLPEVIAQAKAAAARAVTVVSRTHIRAGGVVTTVNEARCTGCGTCESICQFGAIKVDPERQVARVEPALCKGCGACVAGCRCGAATLQGFTEEQIMAEVAAL